MALRNSRSEYGWLAVVLHWLSALTIFGLFGLGIWMVDLGYYDAWYRQAPFIHKSLGITLVILMLIRLFWRWHNISPEPEPGLRTWEVKASQYTHRFFYILFFLIAISGYLISTADGRPISVFGLFDVPATISDIDNQEDIAGEIHEVLAWLLMLLVAVHVAAAFKHHLINKDQTLLKMLGVKKMNEQC